MVAASIASVAVPLVFAGQAQAAPAARRRRCAPAPAAAGTATGNLEAECLAGGVHAQASARFAHGRIAALLKDPEYKAALDALGAVTEARTRPAAARAAFEAAEGQAAS